MSLPIVRFNTRGTVSEKEKRTLVARPHIFDESQIEKTQYNRKKLNKKFFSQFDSYFCDRFGGRNKLISLNKFLAYNVLGANIFNEKAIRGSNGWCFYTGTMANGGKHSKLSDYYKTNLMSENQLLSFKQNVAKAAEWCAENGIKTIFIICPNKHSVYPEKYPFQPRPSGITRSDQMCAVFKELGVPYVFSRDEIISKKDAHDYPLYWETDTHWNPVGAYISFAQILDLVQQAFPAVRFPHIEYETSVSYSMSSGDILPILGIEKSRSTRPALKPKGHENKDFYTYLHYDFMSSMHTKATDTNLPRAVVFHDSFFGALEPFVSPLFSECQYFFSQFREKDKAFLLEYKPDIVLFESIEWQAHSICGTLEL